MTRASIAVAVAVAALLALTATAFGRTAATPTLKGTVGPGFTIKLMMNGTKVKTLKAGSYKFVIADKSSIHSFTVEREKGGKVEKDITSPSFMGTKTVTLKLGPGEWKFYCKPHEATMFGFFTVK